MNIGRFLFNSVFITTVTVTIGIIFNSMLAFALARMEFRFKKIILIGVLALIIVPIESILIPMLLMVNKMGIIDTYTVQILPFIADAFSIFLFYQAFIDLPKELDEAAIVDGAGYFRIYWNLAMPLSKPIIATAFIMNALTRWGDLLWPLMGNSWRGLSTFTSSHATTLYFETYYVGRCVCICNDNHTTCFSYVPYIPKAIYRINSINWCKRVADL